MKTYIYLCLILLVGTVSCKKEDKLFTIKEPPRPTTTFTFTDANGNPTRQGGNTFSITNPGLNGSFTFKAQINSGDSRLVDSVLVEYQYSLLTTSGGASSFGWAEWETVVTPATSPVYDFTYTFNIAELNEFYAGSEIITTGSLGTTLLARDENEARLTAYFNDGTIARSPKLTFTYPVRPSGME